LGKRWRSAAGFTGRKEAVEDCIRVIDAFMTHRGRWWAGVAPCSPFSVSRSDATRRFWRDKGVMLHTHLAENDEDIAYLMEKFSCRPGQYVEDLGWTPDVWHAHC
jgi:cytosine/adenosine deaminase-related metal-dependent hydrolase